MSDPTSHWSSLSLTSASSVSKRTTVRRRLCGGLSRLEDRGPPPASLLLTYQHFGPISFSPHLLTSPQKVLRRSRFPQEGLKLFLFKKQTRSTGPASVQAH